MSAGDLLRAHYITIARVLMPGLPAGVQIDPDEPAGSDGNAWQRGVNAGGEPIFAVRADYVPGPFRTVAEVKSTFAHEEGHAYEAFLKWRDPNIDWRGKWWTFAKLPGTWQQAAADVGPGMLAGRRHPQEMWADAFRAAITGVPHPELAPDPKATLAFFRLLVPEAPIPVPPTPAEEPLNIIWLPSPNFSARSRPIRYIVLHTTEGTDSRGVLTDGSRGDYRVSAHYLVQRTKVYQLVDEENQAWHAGIIVGIPQTPLYDGTNPNEESIGIEMEGRAAIRLDDETLDSTAALVEDIERRRGYLPLVNHSELSPGNRSDPGPQNRAAVEERLGDDMDQDTFNKWFDARFAETPEYQNTTKAIKDALGGQAAAITKLANDETLDDAEVAALKTRIDKLKTI